MKMTKTILLNSKENEVEKLHSFIEENVEKDKISQKGLSKALLNSEESFVQLCKNAEDGAQIEAAIEKRLKGYILKLKSKGEEVKNISSNFSNIISDYDETTEDRIRRTILAANNETVSFSYKNGFNKAKIKIQKESSSIKTLLLSFAIGIMLGVLICFIPKALADTLNSYILISFRTIFINMMKMICGPLIFFSIASAVSKLSDMKELGRNSARIMAFYTGTSILAVILSIVLFEIFKPGEFGSFSYMVTASTSSGTNSISVIDTLINIFPSNFLQAFVDMDTTQIIVLAILFGMASTFCGKYSEGISNFFTSGNELCTQVAALIVKALPIMVICSVSSLIYSTDLALLSQIIAPILMMLLGFVILFMIYGLLGWIIGKIKPIELYKDLVGPYLNAFALCSSNACTPYNMEHCKNKWHINSKLYSFSIPLGATINMDGTSLNIVIACLFFARVYGVEFHLSEYILLALTVIMLTFSAPGIPGAGIVVASMAFAKFGIPMEGIIFYIAIETVLDPFITANNISGDLVGTYSIAKMANLIDES